MNFLVQKTDFFCVSVDMVLNRWALQSVGNFLTGAEKIGFVRKSRIHGADFVSV